MDYYLRLLTPEDPVLGAEALLARLEELDLLAKFTQDKATAEQKAAAAQLLWAAAMCDQKGVLSPCTVNLLSYNVGAKVNYVRLVQTLVAYKNMKAGTKTVPEVAKFFVSNTVGRSADVDDVLKEIEAMSVPAFKTLLVHIAESDSDAPTKLGAPLLYGLYEKGLAKKGLLFGLMASFLRAGNIEIVRKSDGLGADVWPFLF